MNFRNYTNEAGITADYEAVRELLVKCRLNHFTYARWDWMATHPSLQKGELGRMGLWEESGKVVAAAVCDCIPGDDFCVCAPGYERLRPELIAYALKNLRGESGKIALAIPDGDLEYQRAARAAGMFPSPDCENQAVMPLEGAALEYALPDGFTMTDMRENLDIYEYGRCLWYGFNHKLNGEGEFAPDDSEYEAGMASMRRANVDLDLKIAIKAPDGHFAAYCGLWYDARAGFAEVEPLAVVPEYRRMGLARAAVYDGARRVMELGAKQLEVGSNQQFYYSIGFNPNSSAHLWRVAN